MLTMAMPMIVSMILQALYNIVDSYFVSNIPGMGDYAVNALTLEFPIAWILTKFHNATNVVWHSQLMKLVYL